HPRRLRARRVWRLHGAARRSAGPKLPALRDPARWRHADDGGRPGRRRATPPHPGGVPRAPRAAVRVLYARAPADGQGLARRAGGADRRRDRRGNCGQSLPLYGLSFHRGRDSGGGTPALMADPEKRIQSLRVLARLNRRISSSLDYDEALTAIAKAACEI